MFRPSRLACLLGLALAPACVSPPPAYHEQQRTWRQRTDAEGQDVARPDLGPDADREQLVAWALRASPDLLAAAQRWKAALERVPQVGGLPDPQLTFTYYLEEVQSREGPLDWRLGVMQPLPWFGELDLADRGALAEARAYGARFEQARLSLAAEVRHVWAELAWVDAALLATSGHRELLTRWEEVARTRYATGMGDEVDLIRAQVELGQLEDRQRSLSDLRRPTAARLNAALDRPADAPLPRPGFTDAPAEAIDEQALRARLPTSAPGLLALDHRIEAAAAAVEQKDIGFYPRPSVGLDYTRVGADGDDAIGLTAGLSLPIWRGRIRAGVAAAEAEHSAAIAARRAAGNRLTSDLELQLYRLRDAARRVSLYRDSLLPKGRESLDAVDQSYRAGDAGFLDVIDAERVLLEFELALARARADHDQALAALVALTGVELHAGTQEDAR